MTLKLDRYRCNTQRGKGHDQSSAQSSNDSNCGNEIGSLQQSIHKILNRVDSLNNSSAKVIKTAIEYANRESLKVGESAFA